MSKSDKPNLDAQIIPKDDYIPELEEQVAFWVRNTPDDEYNPKLYKRYKDVEFESDYQKQEWQREEIRRIKEGHDGMCGKMYGYFHYGYLLDPERGKIQPDYRVADDKWFAELEFCRDSKEWGLVCVKRRRVGASWKEAWDVLHDTMFNKYYHVGMNSKTERDSIELFKKVKFMYNNLPDFLRATSKGGNTRMSLDFSFFTKDTKGNKIKAGTQSILTCVAPTDSAYEGMMLQKWVCDEAGKIKNLTQMYAFTEPCLMAGVKRVGVPILFGTSGEIGNVGKGLKYIWDNNKAYKMRRFFFAGWMGLIYDERGNDLKEEGIRWIIYERHRRRELDPKQYNDFVQQFPLDTKEAFAQSSKGGLGDVIKVNSQMTKLAEQPPKKVKGKFIKNDDTGEIVFKPGSGDIIIYEHPVKEVNNQYVAGCDPADHDDVFDEASDLSLYIIKKRLGTEAPHIVLEYTARPDKATEFYTQSLYALLYFNKTRVLIESNRYRMIGWFEEQGYKWLMQQTPQGVWKFMSKRMVNNIGIRMNKDVKIYLEGLVEEYIEFYHDSIPSRDLLQECLEYGATNTDRVMAFGIALIMLKDDKRAVSRAEEKARALPDIKFVRNPNGKGLTRAFPKDRVGNPEFAKGIIVESL
jgi:hypothetical protein